MIQEEPPQSLVNGCKSPLRQGSKVSSLPWLFSLLVRNQDLSIWQHNALSSNLSPFPRMSE